MKDRFGIFGKRSHRLLSPLHTFGITMVDQLQVEAAGFIWCKTRDASLLRFK
jgi:hypothetical protein